MKKVSPALSSAMNPAYQLYHLACQAIDEGQTLSALNYIQEALDDYQDMADQSFAKADTDLWSLLFIKRTEMLLGLITESFDEAWRANHYYQVTLAEQELTKLTHFIAALPQDFPLTSKYLTQLSQLDEAIAKTEQELIALDAAFDIPLKQTIEKMKKSHLKKGESQRIKACLLSEFTAVWRRCDQETKALVMNSLPAILVNHLKPVKKMSFIDNGYRLRDEKALSLQIKDYLATIITHTQERTLS